MSVLGIVPARGGSVALPNKNLKKIRGQSLLQITLETAHASQSLDRIIVSTDDEAIARESHLFGAEVPFMRPSHLCLDHVHSIEVVLHCLDWLEDHEGALPAIVVMLLPTAPFRQANHISDAVQKIVQGEAQAIVGVTEAERHLAAYRYLKDGALVPVAGTRLDLQRQDMPALYYVNGLVYVARVPFIRQTRTFHTDETAALLIESIYAVDIDTEQDLNNAQHLDHTLKILPRL